MKYSILIALCLVGCSSTSIRQQAGPTTQASGVDLNTGQAFSSKTVSNPPKEWIDKETGHRVIRLSDEPGSMSLYFHQNAFSPDGNKLTFTSPTGIYQVDLTTRRIERILAADTSQFTQGNGRASVSVIVVGRKTGRIFFTRTVIPPGGGFLPAQRSVWWIDPVSREEHEIGPVPRGVNVGTVNCDETLLAGAITYFDGRGGAATQAVTAPRGGRINLYARWAQHLPMALATMDAQNGEIKTFNPSNDWDNHFQFSPTDPNLLMYCHEGPWQLNDRVWTIRTDGTGLFKVHERTMINEMWGHEFWSADGRTIWYQLYTPRNEEGLTWVAGYNFDTGQQTWYHNPPNTPSIHVNVSKDGSLFAGDGEKSAPWIFLFRPTLDENMEKGIFDTGHLIQPGHLDAERLVNMSNHEYSLEPNVVFTRDMKWIIFRSNMFGPSYVFAVEVAKAK
jgi:oligogalacturonide lyase